MSNYTFYTPINLARNILKLLPEVEVDTIIDICCGSWNLLKAGKEKYPSALITGVDVDKVSMKHKIEKSQFSIMDGRDFAKREFEKGVTYDLILSNPPFGIMKDSERKYIKDECIRKICYTKLLNKRYECEMIQANLLLAHDGSIIVFILPFTFIAGDSFMEARCQLIKDFRLLAVIKLPSTTFETKKISTFAIILQKGSKFTGAKQYEAVFQDIWRIRMIKGIDYEDVKDGYWWFGKNNIIENETKICRGSVSSNKFCERGRRIYHCSSKKRLKWKPAIKYYAHYKSDKNIVKARKGDVIINRVGRDAGYWCINMGNEIPISDCLIIVSNATQEQIRVLVENSDADGRLIIPIRGVAVSYITVRDIKFLLHKGG